MLTKIMKFSVMAFGLLFSLTGCQGEDYTGNEAIAAYRVASPIKVIDTFDKTYIVLNSLDLFEVGKAQIRSDAEDTLKDAVNVVEGMSSSLPITITGFSTSVPADDVAKQLTFAQASAVSSYLWAKGIDPSRIKVVAGGKSHFVSSTESPNSDVQNYRIEIALG